MTRITRAEIVEMFGETMPIEAVNLLWDSPGEMTIGEMRAKLREIASTRTPSTGTGAREISEHAKELLATEVSAHKRRHIMGPSPSYAGSISPSAALRAIEVALRSPGRGETELIEKWRADIQTCLDNLPAYAKQVGLSKEDVAGREYGFSYALAAMSDLQEIAALSPATPKE